MKPRTILVISILVAALLFAGLNWRAFTTPTTLNFAFGQIEAPVGVLMLLALAVLTLLYMLLLAKAEAAALLESRRFAKELEKARKLADRSEESRFQELRALLEAEFEELHERLEALSGRSEEAAPGAAKLGRHDSMSGSLARQKAS